MKHFGKVVTLFLIAAMGPAFLCGCLARIEEGRSSRGGDEAPPGFSADMTTSIRGTESNARIMVQGEKMRMEVSGPRKSSVMITRFDEGRVFLLIPSLRKYKEFPIADMGRQLPMFFTPGLVVTREAIGTETLDGKEVTHSRALVQAPDGTIHAGELWEDPGFPGFPLKWLDDEKEIVAFWRNISRRELPQDLFAIPEEYEPLATMPAAAGVPGHPPILSGK